MEQIIDDLKSVAHSMEDIGLLDGKTGVALYFYHLSRYENDQRLSDFAYDLLTDSAKLLNRNTPINFDVGITGIGWALEHLIQNGFIDGNADQMLLKFDRMVMRALIFEENNLTTIVSIGFYYVSRLRYRINDEESAIVLDLKYNTIFLIDELERQILDNAASDEVMYLLDQLLELNIFNYKVLRLQKIVGQSHVNYLVPFVPSFEREISIEQYDNWGLRNGISGVLLQKIMQY